MNDYNKILSHANLIIVDDDYDIKIIKNLIKDIIKLNVSENDFVNINTLIDNDNYNDIKVLKPDGKYIKKEQISDLISEYKNISIYNLNRYYIIEYAENLNKSAANSLLKFLEEPSDNIVAILITKNISNVLETIISRCKIININNYHIKQYNEELIDKAIGYIKIIEKNKEKSIAYLSELYQLSSEEINDIFQIMILIYSDIQKNKLEISFENYINLNKINELSNQFDIKNIPKKIKKIEDCINLLNYNVNVRIVLDRLILNF
ncbi:MAG: DNA polymerase III subunit delta' C-terminal domain-containing protein [bacterium]|nr:DNA polymerase III subunit delta' C-terminal domain-containing protein [bacterium]